MNLSMVRIALTDEQKLKLKPVFDEVTSAHNKRTAENNLRYAIHGQVWEKDGGYVECRLFDPEQSKIVADAILVAIEIDKRKEKQTRLVEVKNQLASLAKERDELTANLKTKDHQPPPNSRRRGRK